MPSQIYFCQCAGCVNGQGAAFEAAPMNWYKERGWSTPKNCPDCRRYIKDISGQISYCQECGGTIRIPKLYMISHHKKIGAWTPPTQCFVCKRGVDKAPRGATRLASQEKREEIRKRAQERKRGAALAEQAGIPPQYWNDVVISDEPDGSVNIYFGGLFCADGQGHGHYVMDKYGNVTYKRDPQKAHGAQNFADHEGGGWDSRIVGTIEGHEVTARTGWGSKKGHTIIADGQPSGRDFDRRRSHNHYGPKQESDGRIEDDGGDRGYYTGPGR